MNEEPEQPKIVDVEPGEVVLRAQPCREAPQPAPLASVEYCRPMPRERPRWLDEITWPRVLLGLFVLSLGFMLFVPTMSKRSDGNGRLVRAKVDLMNFQTALDAFCTDTGRYPTQAEGLQVLVTTTGPNWHGPYIKVIRSDSWGTPYVYVFPGVHNPKTFDLHSRGPDRREGNDDINNW